MNIKEEFIPLTNDLLFKETLSHKDNREALIDFINSVTNISKKVIRRNLIVKYESVLEKSKLSDKNLRGDVIIECDDYIINLECYSDFDINSLLKSTSYIMRIFSTQLDRGTPYNNMDNVIQVNIIEKDDTKMMNDFINEFYLTNKKTNEILFKDKFFIKYYNLEKLRDGSYNEISDEVKWMKFISAKTKSDREKISRESRVMESMNKWVEEYINDEKTKKLFGEWSEYIALNKGIKKGLKEGMEQGKKEGALEKSLEIAKYLKNMNYNIEEIIKITKLTKEEIEEL